MSYIIILVVQTKLFSDLYLAKFLDSSAKPIFSSNVSIVAIIQLVEFCIFNLFNVLPMQNNALKDKAVDNYRKKKMKNDNAFFFIRKK